MISPENFKEHLDSIPKEKWQALFAYIPIIESNTDFGEEVIGERDDSGNLTLPHWNKDDTLVGFQNLCYDLGLVLNFDWMQWEGRKLLEESNAKLDAQDPETLGKLITCIIRADRFSDGYLVYCFENGTVLKILRGFEKHYG